MQPRGLALERHATVGPAPDVPRVRLADLPRHPSRRGRWGRPPVPHAVAGLTWDLRDRRALHWWPQGIDVVPGGDGRPPLLAVSWYSQRGRATRISLVDLRPTAPRYWHVSLVTPDADGDALAWRPVTSHAGGVAIIGDHLYIAATHGGLEEFRLDRMVSTGGRLALPRTAELRPTASEEKRMRYSFVATERQPGTGAARLAVGEWRPELGGRLARMPADGSPTPLDRAGLADLHDPGIAHMQGVLTHGDTWFVTAANGDRAAGDLWIGERDSLVRLTGELAPGPEDLCLWPERGQLWTVSEYPGRRWVYALDLADVTDRASRAAAAAR